MFFVSETDMLKAIHTALLDEVISSGGEEIDGDRFPALQNFLDLLIQVFASKENQIHHSFFEEIPTEDL